MEAARQKERQILNSFLYDQARVAAADVDKITKGFAKLAVKDAKLAKRIDIDHVDAAREVLAHFGMGTAKPDFNIRAWAETLPPEQREVIQPALDLLNIPVDILCFLP